MPRKLSSAPIGSWMGNGFAPKPIHDHLNRVLEVCADAVHLVDEADARHLIAIRLTPNRLRLRLDTGHGIEHDHAAVQHTQTALHFGREVDMARRVNDVDLAFLPRSPRPSRPS